MSVLTFPGIFFFSILTPPDPRRGAEIWIWNKGFLFSKQLAVLIPPCIFALSTFVNSDSNCPGRKSVQQLCLSLLSTHPAFSYKKFCRLRGLCCLGRIFCKWMFVNIWVNPFKHRCLFHWLCIKATISPLSGNLEYMLLQRHTPD